MVLEQRHERGSPAAHQRNTGIGSLPSIDACVQGMHAFFLAGVPATSAQASSAVTAAPGILML